MKCNKCGLQYNINDEFASDIACGDCETKALDALISLTFKGTNIYFNEPVIKIKHDDLKRFGDSLFRSECPKCKDGILLVYRDGKTFRLKAEDRCVTCGQLFEYTDIDEMRKEDGDYVE